MSGCRFEGLAAFEGRDERAPSESEPANLLSSDPKPGAAWPVTQDVDLSTAWPGVTILLQLAFRGFAGGGDGGWRMESDGINTSFALKISITPSKPK